MEKIAGATPKAQAAVLGPRLAADVVAMAREGAGIRLDYSPAAWRWWTASSTASAASTRPPRRSRRRCSASARTPARCWCGRAGAAWVDFDAAQRAVFGQPFGIRTPDGRVWNPLGKAVKRYEAAPADSLRLFYLVRGGPGADVTTVGQPTPVPVTAARGHAAAAPASAKRTWWARRGLHRRPRMDDGELGDAVARARGGDESAFGVVYREVHPMLLGYLRGLVGDDADDIASETWHDIVRDLRSFRGDGCASGAGPPPSPGTARWTTSGGSRSGRAPPCSTSGVAEPWRRRGTRRASPWRTSPPNAPCP